MKIQKYTVERDMFLAGKFCRSGDTVALDDARARSFLQLKVLKAADSQSRQVKDSAAGKS